MTKKSDLDMIYDHGRAMEKYDEMLISKSDEELLDDLNARVQSEVGEDCFQDELDELWVAQLSKRPSRNRKIERLLQRDQIGAWQRQQTREQIAFQQRMSEARLWAGYTRREMGELLDVGYFGYTHYERCEASMEMLQIIVFKRLTHVDLNWLFRMEHGHFGKKFVKPPSERQAKIRLYNIPTPEILGKRLRLLRMRLGYSREQFGAILFVGERAFGYYEQGERFLDRVQLVKLRMALGVDLNSLFACRRDLEVKFSTAPYIRQLKLNDVVAI